MTHFENLQKMNIDDFAAWLDKYGGFEDALWTLWFDETYCQKCESVKVSFQAFGYESEQDCAPCELDKDKCPFKVARLSGPEVIKLWLQQNVK